MKLNNFGLSTIFSRGDERLMKARTRRKLPVAKRPPPDEKQIERIKNMYAAGVSQANIAKLTGRPLSLVKLLTHRDVRNSEP